MHEEKNRLFDETLVIAKQVYNINGVGGPLHIVLDDGNLKDIHIMSCIEYIQAMEDGSGKEIFLQCANNLLLMTISQRLKLYRALGATI